MQIFHYLYNYFKDLVQTYRGQNLCILQLVSFSHTASQDLQALTPKSCNILPITPFKLKLD